MPEPAPPTPQKGKLGGLPWWAWGLAAAAGLVIGYMLTRLPGAATAADEQAGRPPQRGEENKGAVAPNLEALLQALGVRQTVGSGAGIFTPDGGFVSDSGDGSFTSDSGAGVFSSSGDGTATQPSGTATITQSGQIYTSPDYWSSRGYDPGTIISPSSQPTISSGSWYPTIPSVQQPSTPQRSGSGTSFIKAV
jgi:hypothetical protein